MVSVEGQNKSDEDGFSKVENENSEEDKKQLQLEKFHAQSADLFTMIKQRQAEEEE